MKLRPLHAARVCVAAVALLGCAHAATDHVRSDAISPLVPMKRAIPGADPAIGVPKGEATILSIDDVGPAARIMIDMELRARKHGVTQLDDVAFDQRLAWIRESVRPVDDATGPLADFPAGLAQSELTSFRLLGFIGGLQVDARPLSATRVYLRPDGVLVLLEALRYKDPPGVTIVQFDELLNTRVGAWRATLQRTRTPSGRGLTELGWITDRTSYSLTVFDDVDQPSSAQWNRAWLIGLAEGLGS